MKLVRSLKRWLLYNAMIFPVIAAIYVPYNVLFLQYTAIQLVKWIATSAFVAAGANLVLQPWTSKVVRYLDRRNL